MHLFHCSLYLKAQSLVSFGWNEKPSVTYRISFYPVHETRQFKWAIVSRVLVATCCIPKRWWRSFMITLVWHSETVAVSQVGPASGNLANTDPTNSDQRNLKHYGNKRGQNMKRDWIDRYCESHLCLWRESMWRQQNCTMQEWYGWNEKAVPMCGTKKVLVAISFSPGGLKCTLGSCWVMAILHCTNERQLWDLNSRGWPQ